MTEFPCVLVVMRVSAAVGIRGRRLVPSRRGRDKMQAGIALTDEDRRPWLEAIAAWIDEVRHAGRHGVLACSALKRRYGDVLRDGGKDVRFAYLKGEEKVIARRIAARHEHFMPPRPAAQPVRCAR